MNTLTTIAADGAPLALFVYYTVSLTKAPIGLLARDPATSNWIVRLWAMLLALGGGLGNYFLTAPSYSRIGVYGELKLAAAAGVTAIVTYHIGQSGFLGAFRSAAPPPPGQA